MEQLNLFDRLEYSNYIKVLKIKSKLKEYGIDQLYERKFCNRNYTFNEILETLKRCKTYKKYIKELFRELSVFFAITNDAYFKEKEDILIEFIEDKIILATKNTIGPIFTVRMLESRLKEAKDENFSNRPTEI